MKVLAVYNFKGGVGKTAAAVNLGWLAAQQGWRTLVWDLDPQGAATYTFRVQPHVEGGGRKLIRGRGDLAGAIRATDYEQLDLLPADFSFRDLDLALGETTHPERQLSELVEPLAKDYDLLLFDCPPSISLVSENIFALADVLLAPTIPTPLSLQTLAKLMRHLKRRERAPSVLPFFSMVDRRKSLHRKICAYAGEQELGFLRTVIPYSSAVERMSVERSPVFAFAGGDRASRAYEALWREVRAAFGDEERAQPRRRRIVSLLEAASRGLKRR